MSASQIRDELHEYINKADDRLIRAMYAMMQNYFENDESIVAYTTSREPLTKEEYIKNVTSAYQEAKDGNILTTEELLKEMKK